MLVIGNGESRKNIDINKLEDVKIGCNAIMRDYQMDHLICVDRRMVNEAIEKNVNQHSLIYTRKDWYSSYSKINKRIRIVPELPYVGNERPDDPFHWGSGPYAVLLGAKISKDNKVKLLGFDLYSKDSLINNVYKDTQGYDSSQKRAVDHSYWVYQVGKVFENFTKLKFTIYQEDNWIMPKQWKKSNVSLDSISNIV